MRSQYGFQLLNIIYKNNTFFSGGDGVSTVVNNGFFFYFIFNLTTDHIIYIILRISIRSTVRLHLVPTHPFDWNEAPQPQQTNNNDNNKKNTYQLKYSDRISCCCFSFVHTILNMSVYIILIVNNTQKDHIIKSAIFIGSLLLFCCIIHFLLYIIEQKICFFFPDFNNS